MQLFVNSHLTLIFKKIIIIQNYLLFDYVKIYINFMNYLYNIVQFSCFILLCVL